jgi:hypothetical protein
MFSLASEESLLEAFRPRDRRALELPPGLTFPLFVRDYLAWTHPAGGRVYLVLCVPGGVPTGLAFDRSGGDPSLPHMCDWCHCSGSGSQVGLLTTARNSRKRIGVHVCLDLSCAQKLDDVANRSGRSALDAIQRLTARMARFASEGLGIDLTGAGR